MQQRLPIPLPREKFGSPDESDEETKEEASTATPSAGDPEFPSSSTQSLADQIHVVTTQFDAYWDESQEHRVSLSQDMDAIRAEMATIRTQPGPDHVATGLAPLSSHPATTTAVIL